uniref:Putative secreted peptide n=1 Tax=Anopheles braziliensis TaxID=58242 RepID=A0A2M3ZXK0_9DIPT
MKVLLPTLLVLRFTFSNAPGSVYYSTGVKQALVSSILARVWQLKSSRVAAGRLAGRLFDLESSRPYSATTKYRREITTRG